MNTYAIGDIHGCLKALEVLLTSLPLEQGDLIVTLGDYIDRGSSSFGTLDFLSKYSQTSHLIALLGNHEELLLNARKHSENRQVWMLADGKKSAKAFRLKKSEEFHLFPIPDAHWAFLESCASYFETEEYIFSHAPVVSHKELTEHTNKELRWNTKLPRKRHISGKTNIYGHLPQEDGKPLNLGYAIGLDTNACGGQWLTCLNLTSKEVWRSNEDGFLEKKPFKEIAKNFF